MKKTTIEKTTYLLYFWEDRGFLTWPNKDDGMNMIEICEHDQKYNKYYHNDEP